MKVNGNGEKPIRVCQVVTDFLSGGLERIVVSLINNLDRKKYKPYFICLDQKGTLFDQIELDGVEYEIYSRKAGIDWRLILEVRKFLKENEIDIVHGHNLYPLVYGGYAARLLPNRPKMVYTEQNQIYSASKRDWWGFKLYIKNADIILPVSDDLKKYLIETMHVKGDMRVLYNGIDGHRYVKTDSSELRDEYNIKPDELVIGTAVVISPQKAIHIMIDAFLKVSKQFEKVKLVIAGGGPLREKMIAYASKLGLSERIVFPGYQSDVPKLLSLYDVFLLSSVHEGHPLCLLEALSAGIPVVTTDVGGCAEIVIDKENGFVVDSEDSESFASRILTILNDSELRQKMSENGKKRFWDKFSLEKMVSDHEKIYSEVMKT